MTTILGIDPGVNTGVAIFKAGSLHALLTIEPHMLPALIDMHKPGRVVFEDSRLQTHVWTRGRTMAANCKMARNVGEIDAWCRLITAVCGELKIAAHGISPEQKGAKLNSMQFRQQTGWEGKSNQHERDAAMVAWPYRRAAS